MGDAEHIAEGSSIPSRASWIGVRHAFDNHGLARRTLAAGFGDPLTEREEWPVWSSTNRCAIVSFSALSTSSARTAAYVSRRRLERLRRAEKHYVVDSTGRVARLGCIADPAGFRRRRLGPRRTRVIAPSERVSPPWRRLPRSNPRSARLRSRLTPGRIGSAVLTSSTSRSSPRPDISRARRNGGPPSASIEADHLGGVAIRKRPATRWCGNRTRTRGRITAVARQVGHHCERGLPLVVQRVVSGVSGVRR